MHSEKILNFYTGLSHLYTTKGVSGMYNTLRKWNTNSWGYLSNYLIQLSLHSFPCNQAMSYCCVKLSGCYLPPRILPAMTPQTLITT